MNDAAELQAAWDAHVAEPDTLRQYNIAPIRFGFAVTDRESATVLVGGIQLRRDTAKRIMEQAAEMAGQLTRDAGWLAHSYQMSLRAVTCALTVGTGRKSINLVTGQGDDKPVRMGFYTVSGTLKIEDADKAMRWAAETLTASQIEQFIKV